MDSLFNTPLQDYSRWIRVQKAFLSDELKSYLKYVRLWAEANPDSSICLYLPSKKNTVLSVASNIGVDQNYRTRDDHIPFDLRFGSTSLTRDDDFW
jgi:hypothetical protein